MVYWSASHAAVCMQALRRAAGAGARVGVPGVPALAGTPSRSPRSHSGRQARPPHPAAPGPTPAVSFSWSPCLDYSASCHAFKMAKYQIVMVRHGESEWNKLNKFCGWHDAELSEQGKESLGFDNAAGSSATCCWPG